jgi:hypothetical protein
MRGLPFALAAGALFSEVISAANNDTRRSTLCGCCGSRMPIQPDRSDQTVRCPACARWQRVTVGEEAPWRLTAASAEALRRTGRWLRRL